jgi:hypothetical protein
MRDNQLLEVPGVVCLTAHWTKQLVEPDVPCVVAQGGLKDPPSRASGSSGIGFDSQSVVHRNSELLLASEIALGRLDGDVAEQKLDLIQFATREVAETGANPQT